MSQVSLTKGARSEILFADPLGFPCHVDAMHFAENNGRSHRWWEFEKHFGNIKRSIGKENCRILGKHWHIS